MSTRDGVVRTWTPELLMGFQVLAREEAAELHGTFNRCRPTGETCSYCRTEAGYRILEREGMAPYRHNPVRWQIVGARDVVRSPVHREPDTEASVTICGEEIPAGAWRGDAVDRRARKSRRCPECWKGLGS